jgi:hypothetical protein
LLKKLLRLAADTGTVDSRDLARRLGVNAVLVDQMLEELVRRGYLTALGQSCPVSCEGCPGHETGSQRHQPRLWLLTSKGLRTLRSAAAGGDGAAADGVE